MEAGLIWSWHVTHDNPGGCVGVGTDGCMSTVNTNEFVLSLEMCQKIMASGRKVSMFHLSGDAMGVIYLLVWLWGNAGACVCLCVFVCLCVCVFVCVLA